MGKKLGYLTLLLIANIISFAVFAQDRTQGNNSGGHVKKIV